MKSWPIRVASLYAVIIILFAMLYFIGVYTPASGIEGELYFPYVFASGPIVWMIAGIISSYIQTCIEWLLEISINPAIGVVIIPGILNILLGSVQWYYIAKFIITIGGKVKSQKRL